DLLLKPRQLLGVLNMDLIKWFCQKLGINTKLIRSSELRAEGAKVSRLINICRAIKANSYLSTLGAKDYIDENNLFNDYGIELCYQNYSHPQYKQIYGDFIPYMSIIDLLLNEGNASLEIIRSGQRENIKGT
ncbi:MAG: WbqC family protein, partial [Thermodesulfobacteriota bacterium]